MNIRLPIRRRFAVKTASGWLSLFLLALCPMTAQLPAQAAAPVVLDSIVAVVNRQVILASDIQDDIELSVLDPARDGHGPPTPQLALEQLISRALIQQQIRQEDLRFIEPSQAEVNARIEELRKVLPACVRAHCSTDAGWKAFLAAHDLTQPRVEAYLRNRMEILRFIEERFRQGIQIRQEEIRNYYYKTLLPQYPADQAVPPLGKVSSRIQEILLERQVNALFYNWLGNLRKQGDIEILDPALESPQTQARQGGGSQ